MDIYKEKVVVITGGASGIGKALGNRLAGRGAYVILSDVNTQMLNETVSLIIKEGGHAEAGQGSKISS